MSRTGQSAKNRGHEGCNEINNGKTCLTEYICLGKHVICSSPADIAVQGDLQCLREFTSDLNALKVFDTLSRGLDLIECEVYVKIRKN